MSHFYTDFTLQLNSPPMARFFMLVKNNPHPNHFFTSLYDISKLATPPTIDMVQPVWVRLKNKHRPLLTLSYDT